MWIGARVLDVVLGNEAENVDRVITTKRVNYCYDFLLALEITSDCERGTAIVKEFVPFPNFLGNFFTTFSAHFRQVVNLQLQWRWLY